MGGFHQQGFGPAIVSSKSATLKYFTRAATRAGQAEGPKRATAGVSVIVPAYNAAAFLEACLDSLKLQTLKPLEIIVVDDASSDATSQIASRAGVTVFTLPRNGGAGYARAYGAAKAHGEILAFLDSDCIAPSGWLAAIVREFQAEPALGALGGRYEHQAEAALVAQMARLEEEYAHHRYSLSPATANPPAGNCAFRRSTWENARSGADAYLFRGINSGEDEFMFNEVRRSATVRYFDALAVMHQARGPAGYFRRHVNRGRSFGLRVRKGMLGDAKGGLEGYGGAALLAASVSIGLVVLGGFAAFLFPPALWAVPLFGLLAWAMSADFRAFVARSNAALEPDQKISGPRLAGLLALLPLRTACWVAGTVLELGKGVRLRIKGWINVIISVAHFWMPGRISRLFYFVTSACNARCQFCFNLENVENWKARKPSELSLEEIRQVARNFGRLPYLNISGGEPFMRPDLPDVIEAFHVGCKTQWVTIPTNASLTRLVLDMTQEILSRCPTMFLTVQVSIDGMRQEHDLSRKIEGGFEAMTATLKALSGVRKIYPNLRVQLATAFDDFNVAQMREIVDFCRREFQYDQQLFYLIRETGALITRSKNHLIQPFLKTLRENEELEWKTHRRTLWSWAVRALQNVTYSDILQIRKDGTFFRPCHATRKFVTLYDDGKVSPCEVLEPVSLGNIKQHNYDYYALIRAREAKDFYKEEIVAKKCNCDWMCATPMNMLYDVRTVPRIARALLSPDKVS